MSYYGVTWGGGSKLLFFDPYCIQRQFSLYPNYQGLAYYSQLNAQTKHKVYKFSEIEFNTTSFEGYNTPFGKIEFQDNVTILKTDKNEIHTENNSTENNPYYSFLELYFKQHSHYSREQIDWLKDVINSEYEEQCIDNGIIIPTNKFEVICYECGENITVEESWLHKVE